MREKHEKKNCHAIFNPSKAPDYTGTSRTSYVEDVSLFVSFAFFVVIKCSFYNSLMKSGLICEIIAEKGILSYTQSKSNSE